MLPLLNKEEGVGVTCKTKPHSSEALLLIINLTNYYVTCGFSYLLWLKLFFMHLLKFVFFVSASTLCLGWFWRRCLIVLQRASFATSSCLLCCVLWCKVKSNMAYCCILSLGEWRWRWWLYFLIMVQYQNEVKTVRNTTNYHQYTSLMAPW